MFPGFLYPPGLRWDSIHLLHVGAILNGLPRWLSGKNLPANAGDTASIPELGRSSGERNDYHSSILHGQPHGQRSLMVYSPWGPQRVGHN